MRLMSGREMEEDTPWPGALYSQQQDKERNIQEQADKLLAQASEIGVSVLSKASSFWKEGKERVQKVYEGRGIASSSAVTGRLKWMQDGAGGGEDDDEG
jgi:hypothetical protein